jgi:hypothetical protein
MIFFDFQKEPSSPMSYAILFEMKIQFHLDLNSYTDPAIIHFKTISKVLTEYFLSFKCSDTIYSQPAYIIFFKSKNVSVVIK